MIATGQELQRSSRGALSVILLATDVLVIPQPGFPQRSPPESTPHQGMPRVRLGHAGPGVDSCHAKPASIPRHRFQGVRRATTAPLRLPKDTSAPLPRCSRSRARLGLARVTRGLERLQPGSGAESQFASWHGRPRPRPPTSTLPDGHRPEDFAPVTIRVFVTVPSPNTDRHRTHPRSGPEPTTRRRLRVDTPRTPPHTQRENSCASFDSWR